MAGVEHFPLLALGILRALVEVALLCLAGRGVLALLAGVRRHDNPVYRLFVLVTHPALRLARMLSPPQIIDRHLPVTAFSLLFWFWIGLAWLKKHYCAIQHLACF